MREIERVWDGHVRALHTARDVDAAMAATAAETSLVNVPMMTGGRDAAAVRRYLAEDLLPHLPADLTTRRISRTVDRFRLVDEAVVGFTHDRELPWLLPGNPPTHRRVEVLAITVVTVRQARIVSRRTLWDHTGMLARLGLPGAGAAPAAPVEAPGNEPTGWW
jgi:carboxymethylenebutenolidase